MDTNPQNESSGIKLPYNFAFYDLEPFEEVWVWNYGPVPDMTPLDPDPKPPA